MSKITIEYECTAAELSRRFANELNENQLKLTGRLKKGHIVLVRRRWFTGGWSRYFYGRLEPNDRQSRIRGRFMIPFGTKIGITVLAVIALVLAIFSLRLGLLTGLLILGHMALIFVFGGGDEASITEFLDDLKVLQARRSAE